MMESAENEASLYKIIDDNNVNLVQSFTMLETPQDHDEDQNFDDVSNRKEAPKASIPLRYRLYATLLLPVRLLPIHSTIVTGTTYFSREILDLFMASFDLDMTQRTIQINDYSNFLSTPILTILAILSVVEIVGDVKKYRIIKKFLLTH